MELEFPVVLKKLELMTDDEFFAFCQANDSLELERDKNGNIVIVSPTGLRNVTLLGELYAWNKFYELGYTFDSSTWFKLPNGATRLPDVAWIRKDRWEGRQFWNNNRKNLPPFVRIL